MHGWLHVFIFFCLASPFSDTNKGNITSRQILNQTLCGLPNFSCAMMTAARMMAQPVNSPVESFSPRKIYPPTTAKTDSILINIDAACPAIYFWLIICNVNAIPLEHIPQYSRAPRQSPISENEQLSCLINAAEPVRIPAVRNCIHDIFMQSAFGAKCPMTNMWHENNIAQTGWRLGNRYSRGYQHGVLYYGCSLEPRRLGTRKISKQQFRKWQAWVIYYCAVA